MAAGEEHMQIMHLSLQQVNLYLEGALSVVIHLTSQMFVQIVGDKGAQYGEGFDCQIVGDKVQNIGKPLNKV